MLLAPPGMTTVIPSNCDLEPTSVATSTIVLVLDVLRKFLHVHMKITDQSQQKCHMFVQHPAVCLKIQRPLKICQFPTEGEHFGNWGGSGFSNFKAHPGVRVTIFDHLHLTDVIIALSTPIFRP